MTSIHKNFWCVVALDYDKDESWILDQSQDARDCDLLDGSAGSDNGLTNGTWIEAALPGLYRLELSPWGYQNYEGEWDTGIDVTKATLLVAFPERLCDDEGYPHHGTDHVCASKEPIQTSDTDLFPLDCGLHNLAFPENDAGCGRAVIEPWQTPTPCGGQIGSEWREPCQYCGDGKRTGLPGNACENCMNTGYANPTAEDLK